MRVLVTRAEAQGRATLARLAAAGHDGVAVPLTRIVLDPAVALPLDGAGALIVTSRNAVAALAERADLARLRALPVHAVGERTAAAARDLGFAAVISAAGDRHDLVRSITANRSPKAGRLIWLAGADRTDDLADDLVARGFAVAVVPVYRAEAVAALPKAIAAALRAGRIDAVAAYSPRSAEILCALLRARGFSPASPGFRIHVISEATAEPFRRAGFPDPIVARRPDEAALIESLGSDPTFSHAAVDPDAAPRRSSMAAKTGTEGTGDASVEAAATAAGGDVEARAEATATAEARVSEAATPTSDDPIAGAMSEAEAAAAALADPAPVSGDAEGEGEADPAATMDEPSAAIVPPGAAGNGRLIAAAVVASLIGGALGIGGSQLLGGGTDPSLGAQLAAAEARLAALESAAKTAAPATEAGAKVEALAQRLTGLEQAAAKPAVDLAPIEQRLARIEAAPALTLPADLGDRLAGLEQGARERLEASKTAVSDALAALPADGPARAALADLAARVDRATGAVREAAGSEIATLKAQVDRLQGEMKTRVEGLSSGGQALRDKVDAASSALVAEVQRRNEDLVKALDGMRARVGSIEGLRGEVDGLIGRLGSVEKGQKDVGAGQAKVAEDLGRVAGSTETRLSAVEAGAVAARQAQAEAVTAVALANLESAIDAGRPFKGELEVVRRAAAGSLDLTAFDRFAAEGVPSLAGLRERLPKTARAMHEAEESRTAGDGVFERMWAHATAIVRVRPAGETAGEDLGAAIARLEARMAAGDAVGALAAWKALPETARKVSETWGGALEARVTVDAALAAQTAAVVSKLSQPAQ